jgi:hypothetical protein
MRIQMRGKSVSKPFSCLAFFHFRHCKQPNKGLPNYPISSSPACYSSMDGRDKEKTDAEHLAENGMSGVRFPLASLLLGSTSICQSFNFFYIKWIRWRTRNRRLISERTHFN